MVQIQTNCFKSIQFWVGYTILYKVPICDKNGHLNLK